MSDDNKVSASMTAQDITDINAAIQTIRNKLPFLISISNQERREMAKLGDKSMGFDEKCAAYIASNPEFLPGFVETAEISKDRALRGRISEFFPNLKTLCESVDDTLMVPRIQTPARLARALWTADLWHEDSRFAVHLVQQRVLHALLSRGNRQRPLLQMRAHLQRRPLHQQRAPHHRRRMLQTHRLMGQRGQLPRRHHELAARKRHQYRQRQHHDNYTVTTTSNIFQTVGAGAHYLADASRIAMQAPRIFRSRCDRLKKTTTYPSLIIAPSGGYYGVSQTLSPRFGWDTDLPDLGCPYEPLDYAISFVYLTNATIQVDAGTAICVFTTSNIFQTVGGFQGHAHALLHRAGDHQYELERRHRLFCGYAVGWKSRISLSLYGFHREWQFRSLADN
jgi:hypothetical protein